MGLQWRFNRGKNRPRLQKVAELCSSLYVCIVRGGDLAPRVESDGSQKLGWGVHRFQPSLSVPGPLVSKITALAAKSSSMGVV